MSAEGSIPLPADARCATHPDQRAVAVCDRCGAFTCPGCLLTGDGWARCMKCGALAGPPPVPRQLTSAVVVAAIGMACAPLSLVGIALALSWKWGRRGNLTQLERDYVRWSVVVGVLGLAFSVGIAAFVIWTSAVSGPGPGSP